MHQAGMQHQMAAQDQQFQDFDQVIRGYQSMYNPYSGSQYEVPIGSNWSDAPGPNFQRLDSMG